MAQTTLALALAGFSFLLTVIWGPPLLRVLRNFKMGEQIRVDGPERHFSKLGTPTMGGVMVVLPVALITILLNAASFIGPTEVLGTSVLLPLGVLILFSLIGVADDWEGLRGRRRGEGMRARTKLILQIIVAFGASYGLYHFLDAPHLYMPGFNIDFRVGLWYFPIAMFLIVGFSNAVNLSDGLDGLAGLISATAFVAYGGIAVLQGQIFLARFCFTLVGALFGFLWFNVHPAQLFMGDTGSLGLGATLAVVALMTGQWGVLPIIGIIPVSITLSVMIQTGYFKLTKRLYGEGRRVFKMAPLHHHFELSGWSETQIVQRFWLISLMAAMIGVALSVA
ncbi:MAG: phospho-N-acetylmuramoyl-pentapeptide-transferase [Anaerolineales bacterium]|nr:phospho-N-acetylmuramoyl-pentapeptide-transferase [Chloroflexota bacterium]MBL6980564.1 phospho-N-acetylmuramoyl-pentapeptide-transferase [Anaerolineales bacterium]